MFGSQLLDVVIGVVFVFLALSLVASAAVEFVENILKNRAKDLERGISELVGDPNNQSKFLELVYDHPLINSLFRGKYNPLDKSNLPHYIPAVNFSRAVIDLARQAENGKLPVALPDNLKGALNVIATRFNNEAAALEREVGAWFDTGMDRVSGWYKRRTQWFTFCIGLGLTVLINADTIGMVDRLSRDSALRNSLVAVAQATAQKPPADGADPVKVINQQINALGGLGLGIGPYAGWPATYWEYKPEPQAPTWFSAWRQLIVHHLPGWLVTAIAVSFGAPFWFDALNKLIVIRSTVKPHEKSPEEKSRG